ncbi:MAG TPA: hypothetical protein PLE19_04225 [Planctomycetota bacterium]|nr:hypothetical protein [Planctomycetota bacterium]HRR79744.1 hypothetical protein [Planctomycetota bacterium]HRT95846.1 hypothetical protein [Planctomycetota bacterium]
MKPGRLCVRSLVLLLGLGAAFGAERDLTSYLPAEAWLVIHYDGTHPGVRETPLHAFFQEPEVKAALEKLKPLYDKILEEMRRNDEADPELLVRWLSGCECALALLAPRAGRDEPDIALVANVGTGEAATRRQAEEFLKQVLAKAKPDTARQVAIGALQATCYVDRKGQPNAFVFDGPFLVACDGEELLRKALDPAAPKAPGPAGGERAALRVRYDHQVMLKAFGAQMDAEARRVLGALGLNAVNAAELAFVPRDKRLVTSFALDMPDAAKQPGLLKGLAEAPPFDPALLKMVPREATLFWLASSDFTWLWDEIWAMIARVDAQAAADGRQGLAALEQKAGIKLRDGLLAPLGSGTLALSWNEGAWVGCNVLVQRVRDGVALDKAIAQLVARLDLLLMGLPDVGAVRTDLKAFQYRGTSCRYLWMAGRPALMMPGWTPCYASLGDTFVFASHPLHLKAYLDFLADKRPTILDSPEYQRLAPLVPKGATSVAYGYWPDTMEGLYNTLAPFLMLAQMAADFKPALDLANMPSSRVIRRYSRGSIAYTAFENGRLRAEVQGEGLDVFSPTLLPAGAAAVAAGITLPALTTARTEARLIRDRNNLNQIALGCATYLNEHGDNRWYPKSLAELVDKKIIEKEFLVSPLDDDPPKLPNGVPCSYVSCFEKHPNHRFMDDFPPNVIMAWDRKPFTEGRRSILFFDSHVEVVDEARFQDELRRLDDEVKQRAKQAPPPKAGPAKGEF